MADNRSYRYDLTLLRPDPDSDLPFVATADRVENPEGRTEPCYEITVTFPGENPGTSDSYHAGYVTKEGGLWETTYGSGWKTLRDAALARGYALARRHGWVPSDW